MLDALKWQELNGAIVRLTIALMEAGEARLQERAIQDALKREGVFHVAGIRKFVEREQRTRLGPDAEGLDELGLLERYFELRGLPSERRIDLLERARRIM